MARRVLGTFLSDVPEEIIHAGGLLPFALLGAKKAQSPAPSMPSFACSLVAATLSGALLNGPGLDGVVVPHYCDSSRAFFDVWQKNFPDSFSDLLRLPMKLDSEGAKEYLVGELQRFKEALERNFGVRISDDDLSASISAYNENRRYLRTIKAWRAEDPDFMTNYDFFSLVKSSMTLQKEEHNGTLKNIMDIRKRSSPSGTRVRPVSMVFVSGVICEPSEIFEWMDELGMTVADDDLAVGSRYFSHTVDERGDPLDALAESYFHRIPSTLVHGPGDRAQYVLKRVRESGLRGVVFIRLKFCDPLVYDYPDMKKALDREGVPNILIETDLQGPLTGQIKTRLQAFSEILEGAS